MGGKTVSYVGPGGGFWSSGDLGHGLQLLPLCLSTVQCSTTAPVAVPSRKATTNETVAETAAATVTESPQSSCVHIDAPTGERRLSEWDISIILVDSIAAL